MLELPIHHLALFAAAALAVNLTPGPDMLFVIGTGAARGRRAGVMAALGIGAGCLLHIALAAAGLSALLAASALAFTIIKWVGAAYLVRIGLSMLFKRRGAAAAPATRASGDTRRIFWQGAVTNALNPKVALFFLAFLPQFIEPGAAHQGTAFLALGLLFDVGGTAVNVVVALLASTITRRYFTSASSASRADAGCGAWLQRGVGALFVGLGAKLALSAR